MSVATEYDVIRLDGMPFKIVNGVQVQNLSVFQRKFVIGDYTKDSHPLLSSWVLTDFAGGHGIWELEEGADSARYRWGVIEARRPRQITLPPLVTMYAGPAASACYPLGELANTAYFVYGTDIASWDATNAVMVDSSANLSDPPVAKPVVWRDDMYIPLGPNGYDVFDGTTVTNSASPTLVDMMVFADSLLGIDGSGQLHQSVDGTTWNSLGTDAKLPHGTARKLLMYYDRSGIPTPYIVTDRSVWAIDLAGPTIYQTELQYPRHRDQGLGATVWRGDMYTSVGMGVFRYNGDTVSAMGLDRDHGLPSSVRGRIADLCNEYNSIWGLVEQVGSGASLEETWDFNTFDDELSANPQSTKTTLHQFTGFGWHCMWESSDNTESPTWAMIMSANDEYRLWWGHGNKAATIRLPIDFANARAIIESGDGEFAESGYLYTGHFDAGMANYMKIANAVRVRARHMENGGNIRVAYYCGCQPNPVEIHLGDITENGDTVLYFGDIDSVTGKNIGSPFHEIELRFYLERGNDVHTAPMIESCSMTFLKLMPGSLSWTAQIDLTAPFMGNAPEVMRDKLDELLLSSRFLAFEHQGSVYRVRLAMTSGADFTGYGDHRGSRTINLLEMREDL